MESALFLKLMPLLLENVQSFLHFEPLKEVSDEIVNYNVSIKGLGNRLLNFEAGFIGVTHGGHLFFGFGFGFESIEII